MRELWKKQGRDDAVTPVIAGIVIVAVSIVLGAVAADWAMRFTEPLPKAEAVGIQSTIERTFTTNLTTSNLVLMPIAGAPVLLREAQLTLTIDGRTETVRMSALANRTRDGALWRAGDAICLSGTDAACFRPAGATVTAIITLDNQLLYRDTHHLQAFRILPSGGIQPQCAGPARVLVVGKDITNGATGPQIPVYSYVTLDNGTTVQAQWSGAPVVAGWSSSHSSTPQSVLGLRGAARGFGHNLTYSSWVSDAHVKVLKDGDPVPQVPAFGSQTSVDAYLRPYVDVPAQRMDLAFNEAILLFEFNPSLTSAAADFQDYVALVQFPGGGCLAS